MGAPAIAAAAALGEYRIAAVLAAPHLEVLLADQAEKLLALVKPGMALTIVRAAKSDVLGVIAEMKRFADLLPDEAPVPAEPPAPAQPGPATPPNSAPSTASVSDTNASTAAPSGTSPSSGK